MMRRRVVAGAGAAAVGAATAIAALVIGMGAGWAENTTSSAWGLAADGQFPLEKTPFIESTDGTEQTSSALELPENDFIEVGAVKLTAGDDKASTEVTDITLIPGFGDQIPEELQDAFNDTKDQLCSAGEPLPDAGEEIENTPLGDVIPDTLTDNLNVDALCSALEAGDALVGIDAVNVECEGDDGSMDLGALTLLGQEIDLPELEKDMPILPDNPLLSITANKHTKNDDGSYQVDGLSINIADGAQTINLAGVLCGVPQEDTDVEPTEDNDDDAPAPSPVTTELPVTG